MQGLLARLSAQQKTSAAGSRSTSIASSFDDVNDDEQQSNSDEGQSQQTSNTLKPKLKKTKEEKKPGWGSTAPKDQPKKIASRIDTNMVKLKLLDATRKAIIDKTKKVYASTAMQTDTIKTKLCKDQYVDNQSDLVNLKDVTTETDFEMIAMKSKDGVVIVTASTGQNTEDVITQTVSTQTLLPRSNVSFKRFLDTKHKIQYADDEDEYFDSDVIDDDDPTLRLDRIERRLKAKKKLSRQRSTQKSNQIDIVIEDESDVIAIETIPAELPMNKGSDSEYEDSIQDELDHSSATVIKPNNVKRQKQTDETFNSWNDLHFDDEKVELPRSCFVEDGPTPWSNFQDLVLGQRFLNARLSPFPQRSGRSNVKHVTWSEPQVKIVNDLMQEANALMDMFDQVAMLLGPDIKLHKVSDVENFELPPSKYSEEMAKSCEKLEESLKRLNSIPEPRKS